MTDELLYQGKPLDEWLSVLEKGDPAQREQAVEIWKHLGKTLRDAIPRLLLVLKGEDEPLRLHAMSVLGDLGQHAHKMALALRAALHNIAARDTNEAVRQSAAEALSQIGPVAKTPIPALIDALRDNLAVVRQGAAHALGDLGREGISASAALIAALHDQDLSVRLQAATALWRIDRRDRIAVPVLIKVLEEGDELQRWTAADCLGDIGEFAADALPALTRALAKPTKAALIHKGIAIAIERISAPPT
ncbi:MAG TPA: HEAT repeat domain-containing protein [Gemmataceae bacterium]|jgi:HEAT repeat protein|nr:HEAT repeat domain-containing protein [Gemmataceae bacterium]